MERAPALDAGGEPLPRAARPRAYARWHLGVDDAHGPQTKSRYKFPYGDFENVHRCAVVSAESRAGQYDHDDIKLAAAHLHGMLDALR
jgi:hypothetical protein